MRRLTFFLLVNFFLSGCEKYALDRQMEELCKKDGGLVIYEKVELPSNKIEFKGKIYPAGSPQLSLEKRYGPDYKLITKSTTIKKGDPVKGEGRLDRKELIMTRVTDQKILAKKVYYIRMGGDFIAYAHFSSKICPAAESSQSIDSIFIVKTH